MLIFACVLFGGSWAPVDVATVSEVTSLAQQERHVLSNHSTKKEWTLDDGDTISFKVPTKPFGIPMPKDSEELRARLKLIGTTFQFLKLKFPQKGVLSTCTKAVFDEHIDWLFGEEVWGFTTKGPDGRPAACPHQGAKARCERRLGRLLHDVSGAWGGSLVRVGAAAREIYGAR